MATVTAEERRRHWGHRGQIYRRRSGTTTGATWESGTGALLSDFVPKLLPLRFDLFRLYLIMSLQCLCRALLIVQYILEVLSELAPVLCHNTISLENCTF
jgi:hypothetical protein